MRDRLLLIINQFLFLLTSLLLLGALSTYIIGSGKTVYMIGDSTMSEKEVSAHPETGWGTPFAHYFTNDIRIENHAGNGRSTRTFLEEGRWDPIVENLDKGDYVIIQFGHNDEVQSKEQSTTPENFQKNLTTYIRDTLDKEAWPILLTPIARRSFDENGNLVDTHKEYSDLIRHVAVSENVPLIDMDEKSKALLKELGPEKSVFLYNHLHKGQNPNYPEGVNDNTHFNELGARRMAELALEGVRELELDLKHHIVQNLN